MISAKPLLKCDTAKGQSESQSICVQCKKNKYVSNAPLSQNKTISVSQLCHYFGRQLISFRAKISLGFVPNIKNSLHVWKGPAAAYC